MSWKIALIVALITGILTTVVTAPVADHVTQKMKVSNMEGGRGYLVILFIIVALVGGALLGLLGTKLAHASLWPQFWKASGISLAMSPGALGVIAGLCLLSVPRPPLMDGHLLELEAEVFVPKTLQPKDTSEHALRMSLYASKDDNRTVPVQRKRLKHEGDLLVIPVRTGLNTVAASRMLSLIVDDSTAYTLDMPLQPVPRAEDLKWTERMPMRLLHITGTGYTYTDVQVRYRVVKGAKPGKD